MVRPCEHRGRKGPAFSFRLDFGCDSTRPPIGPIQPLLKTSFQADTKQDPETLSSFTNAGDLTSFD